MAIVNAMDMPLNVQSIMILDYISVTAGMEHVDDTVNNAVHYLTMPCTLQVVKVRKCTHLLLAFIHHLYISTKYLHELGSGIDGAISSLKEAPIKIYSNLIRMIKCACLSWSENS